MTRATLLHVLDRPTALGPDEVRELEQLAQAFPYCQTAHLLLAKAAHDQGTMLAGQRLRRAATYAADRTLLRRLIEQVAPAELAPPTEAPEPVVEAVAAPAEAVVPVAVAAPAAPAMPTAVAAPAAVAVPAEAVAAPPAPEAVPSASAPTAPPAPANAAQPTTLPAKTALPAPQPAAPEVAAISPLPAAETEPAPLPAPEKPVDAVAAAVSEEDVVAAPGSTPAVEATIEIAPAPVVEAAAAPVLDAARLETQAQAEPATAGRTPTETKPIAAAETLADAATPLGPDNSLAGTTPVPEPTNEAQATTIPAAPAAGLAAGAAPGLVAPAEAGDLPAQAPAIRPPAEVGEARFEFGLAEAPAPPRPAYELPGLVDEFAASAVTLSMGSAAGPSVLPDKAAVAPPFTPAAFTGDATVGYALGESSRLGLSMQLLDLLGARAETAESSTAVVAAAQPPAVPLPPTGTFFEPDPLLLDHWATHHPVAPPLPSSLDLINNFLRRQPRLTRPAMLPPSPASQADLSARSTRAEPDLVSENLARIFVRQGKNVRAIEIYEKLMVKHPEKIAYFTAQIQSLQPPA